ncbi:tripartite tricarboxylate transporter permease [Halobium salinum]|uniref:Tripartite tricarboxylate transporter permease n=1 Tax=Halobium salinum TaxID=1364940 RepID=A0ABD5P8L4_9EURY|nr:tripartite tricarboxylate transporter permease [Halobium salinum]
MEFLGVRFVLAPGTASATLAFALGGVLLGTLSGLTPGLHANNFAMLLAAVAPAVPASPTLVGGAMLAAGVVHTFLDVVPALALGVPDAAMAASALPGHQLVVDGRGREALRLSAAGSLAAVALAAPLAIPITALASAGYPALRANLPLVLGAVVCYLVLTEPTRRGMVGGLVAFGLSAALGAATLDLSPAAPLAVGGVLAPLFGGLFGAPVLLDALGGAGVPPQADPEISMDRRRFGGTATAGTVAGAMVGFVPGVSAAVASVVALPFVPGRGGAREFVVATSGANTANAVFALVALVVLGTPRTGVTVAIDDAGAVAGPAALARLLPVVGVAAVAGFALVVVLGDRYLAFVGRVDQTRLVLVVLGGLVGVCYLFAGVVGVGLLLVATVVGLVPPRVGCRRVHLMGVLIGPLVLGV